ncbi:hypothetical protein ACMC56_01290 [Campylobacterota bacterium DY0563]
MISIIAISLLLYQSFIEIITNSYSFKIENRYIQVFKKNTLIQQFKIDDIYSIDEEIIGQRLILTLDNNQKIFISYSLEKIDELINFLIHDYKSKKNSLKTFKKKKSLIKVLVFIILIPVMLLILIINYYILIISITIGAILYYKNSKIDKKAIHINDEFIEFDNFRFTKENIKNIKFKRELVGRLRFALKVIIETNNKSYEFYDFNISSIDLYTILTNWKFNKS